MRANPVAKAVVSTWLLAGIACNATPQYGMGRAEYVYDSCAACHGDKGTGQQLAGAPPLAGREQWYIEAQLKKFKEGQRGAHPDDTAGLRMRPMVRTLHGPTDISLLAEYLASMPQPEQAVSTDGGDATNGKPLYATCISCHGADAKGNEALKAPSLIGLPDWYMLTQLKNFKAGIRGSNAEDTTGVQMRAMANVLADEQAMKDVIAHIQRL